jgi:hypothetical protein
LIESGKKTDNPFRLNAARFLGRLFLSFLAVVALFYIIGPFYIRLILPVFSWEIEMLNPEYRVANNEIIKVRQIDYLQMDIEINIPHSSGQNGTSEPSHVTRHKAQASSLCISPIIIISLILSWPSLHLHRRLKAFVFSLPLIVLIQCLDYPIIFMSNIASVYSSNPFAITIFKIWAHILNNGGRQFLSLIGFLILIAPHYLKNETKPQSMPNEIYSKTSKNSPCPCGSGKKYKNCCLPKFSDHTSTGN